MKKRSHFILALLVLLLALPAGASAKVGKDFFGIAAVNPTEADYKGMEKTGFGVSRFEINWGAIQRTRKGPINWSYVDALMILTAKAGMNPSVVVYGTPRFVKKSPNGFYPPTASKEDLDAWRAFMTAAANRYGANGDFWDAVGLDAHVSQWIIWNEPNARNFWKPAPNPEDYAKLVKASDIALSESDPNAHVTLGGMYCCPNDSITGADFLERMYDVKNIEKHFDSINVHPYGPGVSTVRKQIGQLRSVARKAGDKNVGTIVGELGWASTGPSRSDQVVGAKGQAKRLSKSLKLLVQNKRKWNITGAYVYLWRDFDTGSACLWCPGAGLVELDGTAKPALKAVKAVIKAST